MPAQLSEGNCNYTPLSTAGTYTLDPGVSPPAGQVGGLLRSHPGVFYGVAVIGVGTAAVYSAFDVLPPASPGGASPGTNTLMGLSTATAVGQQFIAGLQGVGVRFKGQLLLVVAATAPGAANALWD
jgi:hypothetical protein